MRYLGCDIAPNHSGFVMLDDEGTILATRFSHHMLGVYKHGKSAKLKPFNTKAYRMPKTDRKTGEDPETFKVRRLFANYEMFKDIVVDLSPTHVSIEGYAYSRGTSAYTIAETAGMVKLLTYNLRLPLRVYTPNDVKLFETGFGCASKTDVADVLRGSKGVDFSPFAKGSNDDVVFDLSDAYVLADLLRVESQLRLGRLRLEQLDERTIRVFQRTTERHPVNILGRDWIQR